MENPLPIINKKDGLCNNEVGSIYEDETGNLLFGTQEGIRRYDGKTFTNFTPKEGLEYNHIFCSVEDNQGNLWFGGSHGRLYRYDGKDFVDFSMELRK